MAAFACQEQSEHSCEQSCHHYDRHHLRIHFYLLVKGRDFTKRGGLRLQWAASQTGNIMQQHVEAQGGNHRTLRETLITEEGRGERRRAFTFPARPACR